ncbi:MAG: hypothetical protein AMXMBFR16_12720 [Candidatus Uhrbacteria bacterium]|jgi:putative transcriptional regulator
MQNIPHLIRQYRRWNNITQAELADRVGVKKQHISNIENGRAGASPQLLEKILVELNLEIRPVDKAQ